MLNLKAVIITVLLAQSVNSLAYAEECERRAAEHVQLAQSMGRRWEFYQNHLNRAKGWEAQSQRHKELAESMKFVHTFKDMGM